MDILITHKFCPDGMACAAIARVNYPKCKIYYCEHGDKIPLEKLKNQNVVIADFSFGREELLAINEVANSLQVLDHHKSVEQDLADLEFCHFDMKKCGSMLLWDYLNPNQPSPKFLQHIQDRDIWEWKLPDSREFLEGLDMSNWTLEDWVEAIGNPNFEKLNQLSQNGKIAIQYKKMILEKTMYNAFETNIELNNDETITVWAVNSAVLASDLGHLLAKLPNNKSRIGVVFSLEKEGHWKFGLRSIDDVDTIRIAKYFGGGGHTNASAFRSKDYVLKPVS